MENKVNVSTGGYAVAVAMLFIAFYGDPDLIDAIIQYLNQGEQQ